MHNPLWSHQPRVNLSEVVVRKAHDNAVEGSLPSDPPFGQHRIHFPFRDPDGDIVISVTASRRRNNGHYVRATRTQEHAYSFHV